MLLNTIHNYKELATHTHKNISKNNNINRGWYQGSLSDWENKFCSTCVTSKLPKTLYMTPDVRLIIKKKMVNMFYRALIFVFGSYHFVYRGRKRGALGYAKLRSCCPPVCFKYPPIAPTNPPTNLILAPLVFLPSSPVRLEKDFLYMNLLWICSYSDHAWNICHMISVKQQIIIRIFHSV